MYRWIRAFTEPGEAGFLSGGITGIDDLVKRIENEEFDLVAVGRALIANADWVHKVQKGYLSELKAYDKAMLASLE